LGNNRAKTRKESLEENNISPISSKRGGLRVVNNSPSASGYTPGEHVILAGTIGSLLLFIGGQNHKIRNRRNSGTRTASSSYK